MKLNNHIANHLLTSGRALALLAGVFLLNACATQSLTTTIPPPLANLGPVVAIPAEDVLEVTPEMEAFLERYVLPYQNLQTRLNLLTTAIISSGVLGFYYNETRTLTASQAFAARSGNCIGFANLMVALARKAGLSARYQEVRRMSQWSSRADTLLLVKHINVVVFGPGFSYVIDVSGLTFDRGEPRRLVSDDYAKALFYNNLGAEALLQEDLTSAWSNLVTATRLQSGATDPWINLGVVYKRNGQARAAEVAYHSALQINPRDYSAMNNLYELYLTEDNLPAAAELADKVDQYRRKNPYFLMKLSEVALQEGDFDYSIDLISRAIKKKDDDALLYFAMAKAQFLSGNALAAENSLMQARDVAPENQAAFYGRPLDELVMESLAGSACAGAENCQ